VEYRLDTQYHQFPCWPELEQFLKSILPHTPTRVYFLNHLATCLSGVFTQRFHILTGSGSNGKSMLMNLCATAFGDYCYKANIAMFTQKRGAAGAANPELVRMRGKRFVFMSEPDEGEPLSTGFMKELTSSEKVTGRDLFKGSKEMVEFDVQAKCHLACNDKPKVNSNDGGTWRRLKVIEFSSKFVANPKAGTNELEMDESIMHKVLSPEWAECFMAYLIHLHMEGKGLTRLTPPKDVEKYTNEYKEESDAIARFMGEFFHTNEETVTDPAEGYEKVSWTEIATAFKDWKRQNEVSVGIQELRKRVEALYGKLPAGGWASFRFGQL
jgi:P4 family phage/plasmid primase-like protien